ncbi:MAG: right-handed parallel beta-helix repeat-containing protein [Planctomycetota bacterium]
MENCRIENLKGRGFAAYGMNEVLVEGCYFANADSQAIELDHFSSGQVRNNESIHSSGVGIALNDAFDSVVEGNVVVWIAIPRSLS